MAEDVWNYHCFYSGRVQGVGFRYKTLQTAREFEVAGFVRNLEDGRVELEVEGQPGEVQRFVAEVEDRLGDFIRKKAAKEGYRQSRWSGFRII